MKTIPWKAIESSLRQRAAGRNMRDADAFAADFKARAALTRQVVPVDGGSRSLYILRWGYAMVFAMLLVVIGVFSLPLRFGAVTQIKALEVVAPHDGVIIMNDQAGRGTILWISGMASSDSGG